MFFLVTSLAVGMIAGPRIMVSTGRTSTSGDSIMAKMSISDLRSKLAAEKADALVAISAARLAEERADATDYYLGQTRKDMPARAAGHVRSRLTLRTRCSLLLD